MPSDWPPLEAAIAGREERVRRLEQALALQRLRRGAEGAADLDGEAAARALAAEGATVAVTARAYAPSPSVRAGVTQAIPGSIEETIALIEEAGGSAFGLAADLDDPAARDGLVDAVVARTGRLERAGVECRRGWCGQVGHETIGVGAIFNARGSAPKPREHCRRCERAGRARHTHVRRQ